MKKLSEMTLQELWQIFPIYLTEPNGDWAKRYAREAQTLQDALAFLPRSRISHIGSTAIRGIWAKPIVDILVEVPPEVDLETLTWFFAKMGYTRMSESPGRISWNKGYTESGFADEVFHLHLREWGDCAELYFRDYLNAHEPVAKAYEALKLSLWKRYEHDRDGYTAAKGDFIGKYTRKACELYAGRYAQEQDMSDDLFPRRGDEEAPKA